MSHYLPGGAFARVEPAWAPRVGELCEVTIIGWSTLVEDRGKLVRGTFRSSDKYSEGSIARIDVPGDGLRSVEIESLRPVAQPPIPAADRLHEEGCAFCGKGCSCERYHSEERRADGTHRRETSGRHNGAYYFCNGCHRQFVDCFALDKEFDRRKSLASNARHCDKCMNPAVSGATLCGEHVAGLGKAKPSASPVASGPTCARCGGEPHATHNPLEPTGICAHCTADVMGASERGGSTAADLAWCIRVNAGFGQERKRRHYEERCAAYQIIRIDENVNARCMDREMRHAKTDAAMRADSAAARTKKEEGAAYTNPHWGPHESGPGWED